MSDTAMKKRFVFYVIIIAFSTFAYGNEIASLPASGGKVILNWDDNAESDLAGYNVYRSTSQAGPFSIIVTNVATSYYEDNNVTNGIVYFYYVTAVDTSDNESRQSNNVASSLLPDGDLNGDGLVDMLDYSLFAANWLDTGCGLCGNADLTGDSQVNISDLHRLAELWFNDYVSPYIISRWTFDSDASDMIGGQNGVLTNGASIENSEGDYIVGTGAISLDGVDDYVNVNGFYGITGDNPRTCAAWIKTSGTDGDIISWGITGPGSKWNFRVDVTGVIRTDVKRGNIIGSTPVTDGNWHHVAIVLNGGDPDISQARLYVDGVRETISSTTDEPVNTRIGDNVKIGAWQTRYFAGQIDDVRIYNRALNDAEILSLAE